MNLTYQKKLFLSLFILLFTFVAVIFPFADMPIISLFKKTLLIQTYNFSRKLENKASKEEMIAFLKSKEYTFFIRVTVLDKEGGVFYDSHAEKILGEHYEADFVTRHPVIARALVNESGYQEAYSELFKQRLAYTAVSFVAKDQKQYVVRTAYPLRYIEEMIGFLELTLVFLSTLLLLVFSLLIWGMAHYLSRPIQRIIDIIRPYQEGRVDDLSKISINLEEFDGDFGKLAKTLTLLSQRVQEQMRNIEIENVKRETILSALVEGVVAISQDQKIRYVNQAAGKMLGIDPLCSEELYFHQVQEPDCEKLLKQSMEHKKIVSEEIHLRKQPEKFFKVIVVPVIHAQEYIIILQDYSDYYKTIEMKKDFIANASHELKTPLTIIRGYSETLRDYENLGQDILQEIATKIVDTSDRMNRLILDLLLLSDTESIANYNLSKEDLKDVIPLCIKDVKKLYPKATFLLEASENQYEVNLDKDLFKVAVLNLLKNAVRYSEEDAEVQVTIGKQENTVFLKVQDKGRGIPKEDLPHIFDRFYTVDKSHSRKMGGSGLGLSITKTIVNKHRGKIHVDSEIGKGTTFTLILKESGNEA